MCGRYYLVVNRDRVVDEYNIGVVTDIDHVKVFGRYNIAPTQPVAVVVPGARGRMLTAMRWGIIPQWMKAPGAGKTPAGWINARAETAATKPAFRGAYKYRRCIVPAGGFYEWHKRDDGAKQPYMIHAADDGLLSFAGLWETWHSPDGSELDTVTILTTGANTMMRQIHERMPVILQREDCDRWMTTPAQEADALSDLLRPYPDGLLDMTPVSRRVNSPRNDDAGCHAAPAG